jgi:hypothetical protein
MFRYEHLRVQIYYLEYRFSFGIAALSSVFRSRGPVFRRETMLTDQLPIHDFPVSLLTTERQFRIIRCLITR